MDLSFTVNNPRRAIGQNLSRDFGLFVNNRHDRALIWLTFLFDRRLENGRVFKKFNMTFFELLRQRKLLFIRVHAPVIWRAF